MGCDVYMCSRKVASTTWLQVDMYICMHVYTHQCLFICVDVATSICRRVDMYVCADVCVYLCKTSTDLLICLYIYLSRHVPIYVFLVYM